MIKYIIPTFLSLLFVLPVHAQSPIELGGPLDIEIIDSTSDFSETAGIDGSNPSKPTQFAVIIIHVALALSGSIFVLMMVFAGYRWLTAAGNDDAVAKAKELIKQSVIGIVIIIAGYTISYFALKAASDVFSNYGNSTITIPTETP